MSLPCLATVKYDYTGIEDSELTVKKGDKVTVEQVDVSGWCLATTEFNRSGSVPFSYLELYAPVPHASRRTTPSPHPSRATPPPPKIQHDIGTRRRRTPVSAWSGTPVSERPQSAASVNSEDDLPPPPSNPPDEEYALPSSHGVEEEIPPPPREPARLTPLPSEEVLPPPPPGEDDDSDVPLSDSEDGQKKPRPRKKLQNILKEERAIATKDYFAKFQEPSEDVGLNEKGEFDANKWASEMLTDGRREDDEGIEEPGGIPTRASMSSKKTLRPTRRERKSKPPSMSDLMQLDLSSVTGDLYHPELMTPMVMNANVPVGSGHNPFGKQRKDPIPVSTTTSTSSTTTTTTTTTTPNNQPHPPVSSPVAQDTPSSTTADKQYRFSKNSSRTNSVPSNNGDDLPPERRGWKYALFDFRTDCSFCLTAVFCPCIAIGKNYALRKGRESKSNTFENQACWWSGVACCFGGCFWLLPCHTVSEHRKTTAILGILPTDNKEPSGFMLGCCYPCTLTLDHQELMDWTFHPRSKPKSQVMEDGGVFGNDSEDYTVDGRKGSKGRGGISSPSRGEIAVHWHGGSSKN